MKQYILSYIFLFSFLIGKGQSETWYDMMHFSRNTIVENDASLKSDIDSIFPNVSFIVKTNDSPWKNWLFSVIKKDTTYIENYNFRDLQLQIGLTRDSVLRYSDKAVANCYIVFDIINRQGGRFPFKQILLKKSNISLKSEIVRISERDEKYKYIDPNMNFINMRATVLPDTAIDIWSRGRFNKIVKIEYEFQIVNKIICGVVTTFYTVNGVPLVETYRNLNVFNIDYEINRYRNIRKSKQSSSSYAPSPSEIMVNSPNNIEWQDIPNSGPKRSLNITIEDNGSFTTGSTKFLVSNLDNTIENPELQFIQC